MRERMLAGDLYLADDPELIEQNLRAMDLMEAFDATPMRDAARRRTLPAELLGAIGDATEIRPPLRVGYGRHIGIGARTFVNFGPVALDVAPITIGNDVQIGTNVQLLTPTHPLDPAQRRAKWESAAPITIADNVWPGSGAIVLPGVTIGENTVVGAGSVVTGDLAPNVVAVGNPARMVRTLTPPDTVRGSPVEPSKGVDIIASMGASVPRGRRIREHGETVGPGNFLPQPDSYTQQARSVPERVHRPGVTAVPTLIVDRTYALVSPRTIGPSPR